MLRRAIDFLSGRYPAPNAVTPAPLHIGIVAGKEVYRPWPALFRHVGADGSGRRYFVRSVVSQAISQGLNVIALTTSDPQIPYLMVDASVAHGRDDKVYVGSLHQSPENELQDAILHQRLVCIDSDAARSDAGEGMKRMLTVLTEHFASPEAPESRTLIVLDDLLTCYRCSEQVVRLVEACAQQNVTVLLSDRTSEHDPAPLLRQCDVLAIGSVEPRALAPLLKTLTLSYCGDVRALSDFREGAAIVAYRDFVHPTIFSKAELSWDTLPDACPSADDDLLVKMGTYAHE